MSKDLINIENMTPEEMDFCLTKIMVAKQNQLERELKQIKERQLKLEESNNIRFDEVSTNIGRIGEEIGKTKDMVVATQRADKVVYGWVNQGDFGRFFEKSIGAKTMGKLLKAVGLAMKTKGSTTPYRQHIPRYAMTKINKNAAGYDYTAVQWNYELCRDFIDRSLKENGYYEAFYSAKTSDDMKQFIDYLYDECF